MPTPTPLRLLRGETRPSRLPQGEPRPRPLALRPPRWLTRGARAIWRDLAPRLAELGVLTEVDEAVLAGFCSAYDEAVRLERDIAEHGISVETQSGYRAQRPEVAARRAAWERVRAFGAELGIGAASRTRVRATPREEESDPLSEVIAATQGRRQRRSGRG